MNHRSLLFVSSLTLFIVLAYGPREGRCGGEPAEQVVRKQAEASFKNRDKNKDGFLDKDEMPGELQGNLAKFARKHEDRVNFEEYLAFREETFRMQILGGFLARDRNQNGYLDKDEASDELRTKYDRNGDGLIDLQEYVAYQRDRLQLQAPPPAPDPPSPKPALTPPPRIIIMDDGELEKRPAVYRAGNLPKGMPAWFEKFDADEDGQIALWEWRQAGRFIKDFAPWDRNDDGLITIEEILHNLDQQRLAAQTGRNTTPVGAGLDFREAMQEGAASTYYIRLEKGKTYRIDMVAANPQFLDPYLYLLDHKGKLLAKDDDGGGQLNARILYKANATGNFRIVAASVGNRGTGDFMLIIREKTPPSLDSTQLREGRNDTSIDR